MASVTGITAQRTEEILDQTIASAAISGSSLVFTRTGGSTFSAGNFQTYINSQVTPAVDSAVDAAVPAAVVGGVTQKGNITGSWNPFGGLTPSQLPNRIIRATLIGNVGIASGNFPAGILPGTQVALVLKQDGTGNRTVTWTAIKRSQGVLTLSTAPNSIDIISLFFDGTDWFAGPMGLGFS